MKLIALNKTNVSLGPTPVSPSSTRTPPLPRFNLKKRSVSDDRESISLAVVNSAFLSGLFADVAKVQVASPTPPEDSDPRLDSSKSCKKTRLSKTKSMTRCGKSFKLLSEAQDESVPKSPAAAADFFGIFPASSACRSSNALERHDSLHYQLSCVSRSSSSEDEAGLHNTVIDAGKLAFPRLPSVVGASSSKLTRNISDLQMSVSETPPKDSYGWFVEMDNDDEPTQAMPNPYGTATATPSANDLAFMAPTAPKAANYDAEVEWAKAADTVDDVLGDFF